MSCHDLEDVGCGKLLVAVPLIGCHGGVDAGHWFLWFWGPAGHCMVSLALGAGWPLVSLVLGAG